MILELTVSRQGNSTDKTTTHHEFEDAVEDIMAWARGKLTELNKDKASFEKLYVLSGVKEYHLPDPSDPKVHDWQPTSFTLSNGGVGYKLVRCDKCGVTGVKYENKVHADLDRKYTAKYYQKCSEVIKHKERSTAKKERRA